MIKKQDDGSGSSSFQKFKTGIIVLFLFAMSFSASYAADAEKDELKENNLSVITYTITTGTDATANKSLFDSISSEETL